MTLMNLVLFSIAICTLSQSVSGAKFPIENYLDLPKAEQFDEPLHKLIREAILRLKIEPNSEPESIRSLLKRKAKTKGQFQSVYHVLSQISPRHGVYPCQLATRNLIRSLLAQMRANPEGSLNEKLAKFFNSNVRNSFELCSDIFERDFRDLENICDISKLDEFFIIGLDLIKRITTHERDARDYEIGVSLQEFDPARDKLKKRKLLRWLKRNHSRDISPNPLNEFIHDQCEQLNECFGAEMQIINIAAVLGAKPSSFGPTVKLNEYNRLCRAWSR